MSPNATVELSSRVAREACLTKFNEQTSRLKSDGILSCARGKTSVQLKRNGALVRVCEALKKDARCKDKKAEINWKKEDAKDKDRSVDVDNLLVFLQKPTDLIGTLDTQFQDISV